jgi:hypothetical protein
LEIFLWEFFFEPRGVDPDPDSFVFGVRRTRYFKKAPFPPQKKNAGVQNMKDAEKSLDSQLFPQRGSTLSTKTVRKRYYTSISAAVFVCAESAR